MKDFGVIEKEYSYSLSWMMVIFSLVTFGGLNYFLIMMLMTKAFTGGEVLFAVVSIFLFTPLTILFILMAVSKAQNKDKLKVTTMGIIIPQPLKREPAFVAYSDITELESSSATVGGIQVNQYFIITDAKKYAIARNMMSESDFREVVEGLVDRGMDEMETVEP